MVTARTRLQTAIQSLQKSPSSGGYASKYASAEGRPRGAVTVNCKLACHPRSFDRLTSESGGSLLRRWLD